MYSRCFSLTRALENGQYQVIICDVFPMHLFSLELPSDGNQKSSCLEHNVYPLQTASFCVYYRERMVSDIHCICFLCNRFIVNKEVLFYFLYRHKQVLMDWLSIKIFVLLSIYTQTNIQEYIVNKQYKLNKQVLYYEQQGNLTDIKVNSQYLEHWYFKIPSYIKDMEDLTRVVMSYELNETSLRRVS